MLLGGICCAHLWKLGWGRVQRVVSDGSREFLPPCLWSVIMNSETINPIKCFLSYVALLMAACHRNRKVTKTFFRSMYSPVVFRPPGSSPDICVNVLLLNAGCWGLVGFLWSCLSSFSSVSVSLLVFRGEEHTDAQLSCLSHILASSTASFWPKVCLVDVSITTSALFGDIFSCIFSLLMPLNPKWASYRERII